MLKEERQKAILNEVELHGRILLSDMAEALNVSIDTVRRDVKELNRSQKLKKVHGGAISLGFNSATRTPENVYALEDKIKIAEKAISLVQEGTAILIHGGTTCIEFARKLPSKNKLTVFTLSLPVAEVLMSKQNIEVIFIGGMMMKSNHMAMGPKVVAELQDIKLDMTFMGTGYMDLDYGLTDMDYEVVQVKKQIIASSKKTIVLTISSKLNSKHKYRTCKVDQVDTLVTELDPNDPSLEKFKEEGIKLL